MRETILSEPFYHNDGRAMHSCGVECENVYDYGVIQIKQTSQLSNETYRFHVNNSLFETPN